jgi:hypothetical protein
MAKIIAFVLLLGVACVVAGLYGMVHNQISYTVSPEYFTAYKFRQFGIPAALQGRAGAALVGFLASWWMGVLIGLPVLFIGLILPSWKLYASRCLIAMGVVVVTALLVGLAALVIASFAVTDTQLPAFRYPLGVVDKVAFARAGIMHDFSYLGGFLGIVTASLYLIVIRIRLKARPNPLPQ